MLHDPRARVIVVYTKPVSEMRFATASKLLHIYIACQIFSLCTLTQKSFNFQLATISIYMRTLDTLFGVVFLWFIYSFFAIKRKGGATIARSVQATRVKIRMNFTRLYIILPSSCGFSTNRDLFYLLYIAISLIIQQNYY